MKRKKLYGATCEDNGKCGSHSVKRNREINNERSESKDKRYLKVRDVLSYLAITENTLNQPEFTLESEPVSNTKRVSCCFVKKLYNANILLLKEL